MLRVCLTLRHLGACFALRAWHMTREVEVCFTRYMRPSDQNGDARVDAIRAQLEACGLLPYLHGAVREVWRANRDRYEPEELFDDAVTLGFGSARNLGNRVRAELHDDQDLKAAGVHVTLERNATVAHASNVDLRLVKAPQKSGRRPRFGSDFRWTDTEGRLAAAHRNFAAYTTHRGAGGTLPLFELPEEDDRKAIERCRDVFLVWSGDLESGLTAGWLGLPTIGVEPFLSVTPAWWDKPSRPGQSDSAPAEPSGDLAFGDRPAPTPVITLKPQRKEENNP